MAFPYAVIVLLVMLVLGLLFVEIGLNSAKLAYSDYHYKQAQYLADAAVNHALWMMSSSPEGLDGINTQLAVTAAEAQAGVTRTYNSPSIGGGTDGWYQFRAVAPHKGLAGTAEIHALGTAPGGIRDDLLVVIKTPVTPVSQCFDYAIFSDHNLINNNVLTVQGHPELGGRGVYANGYINTTNTTTVYGPIRATSTIGALSKITQVPTTAGLYPMCAKEPMPIIDLAQYRAIADEVWGNGGTVAFSGKMAPFGTPQDPQIIYVDGVLKISGPLTGCGIIVASGGITITGTVSYGTAGSSWAMMTSGPFNLTNKCTVVGLLYAHNPAGTALFKATGEFTLTGSLVADTITLTNKFGVTWDPSVTQLGNLPGDGTGQPEIVFWERV
jgi:hypothetical protein